MSGSADAAGTMSAPTLAGLYRAFARNAAFLVASRAGTFLVNLLLIPYLIARVGVEGYGILAAAGAVAGVVGALDLGLSTALIKFLAEHVDRKDPAAVNRTIWSALIPLAALSAVLAVVAAAAAGVVLGLFQIPAARLDEAWRVYAVLVGAILFVNTVHVFEDLLWAMHRADLISRVRLGMIPLYALGVVWAVESGHGLVGVAAAEALTFLAVPSFAFIWIARAVSPALRLHPGSFDRREALSLLSYGARIQLTGLAHALKTHAGRFVAGLTLGLWAVTFYDLAARLAFPLGVLPNLVIPILMPIYSQLGSRAGGRGSVGEFYGKSMKLIWAVLVPAAAFGSAFAAPIVGVWLGPGYGVAAFGFACLLWLYLFEGVSDMGRPLARGMGHPGLEAIFEVGRALVGVMLALIWAWAAGFAGLVLALTLSSIVISALFLQRLCRLVEVRGWEFAREVFAAPLGAAGVAVILAAGLFWVLGPLPALAGRLGPLARLSLAGAAFLAVYGLAIVWSGHLTPREFRATYEAGADEQSSVVSTS